MSWLNNTYRTAKSLTLSLAAVSLLAACGFEPVHGRHKSANSPLSRDGVKVETSAGSRVGQLFKKNLEDALNPSGVTPPKPRYRLVTTLVTSAVAVGVARDGTASRYNLYLDSTYDLFTTDDNKKIASGKLRQVNSYSNIANEYFSTYVSEEDALKRGVIELSEQYRMRLATYIPQEPKASVAPKTIDEDTAKEH